MRASNDFSHLRKFQMWLWTWVQDVCVCDRERVKVQQEGTAKLSKGANHNHVREQRGSHVRQLAHWTLPLRRILLKSLHRVDSSTEKQPWLVSSRQLSTSDATTELVLGRTLVPHSYLIQYRKWRGKASLENHHCRMTVEHKESIKTS